MYDSTNLKEYFSKPQNQASTLSKINSNSNNIGDDDTIKHENKSEKTETGMAMPTDTVNLK